MRPQKPGIPVTLNHATERRPRRWRTQVAMVIALAGGLAAGYGLSFSGFGFFPAWLFLTCVCPVVICLITASRHLLVATLFAATMMGFLLFRVLVPAQGGYQMRPDEQRGVFILMAVLAGVSVAIAAGIGAGFRAKRRAAEP